MDRSIDRAIVKRDIEFINSLWILKLFAGADVLVFLGRDPGARGDMHAPFTQLAFTLGRQGIESVLVGCNNLGSCQVDLYVRTGGLLLLLLRCCAFSVLVTGNHGYGQWRQACKCCKHSRLPCICHLPSIWSVCAWRILWSISYKTQETVRPVVFDWVCPFHCRRSEELPDGSNRELLVETPNGIVETWSSMVPRKIGATRWVATTSLVILWFAICFFERKLHISCSHGSPGLLLAGSIVAFFLDALVLNDLATRLYSGHHCTCIHVKQTTRMIQMLD